NLVQNGAGSHLDVSTNSTLIHGDYELGEGLATVGSGQTLTADNVQNSAGSGSITVGGTLDVGGGSVAADTLSMEGGSVNAAGGISVDLRLEGSGNLTGDTPLASTATMASAIDLGGSLAAD